MYPGAQDHSAPARRGSAGGGDGCVELAALTGVIGVRDSKAPLMLSPETSPSSSPPQSEESCT
ncbi:DUF397 domain-containing protein [Actinomadura darangshiensis]|uniref:DUF397 domain-containing protein n=1 Tax=Actinomadura darangshiensis TaxID=705336 RepID=A0A4R5BE82_9ACTN|nr:DUF397 domain-containing protein [Actinomadura darangshiensis]TDD83619.1 DUF397 domain-containing protein [Actinomadura darangshiensis]